MAPSSASTTPLTPVSSATSRTAACVSVSPLSMPPLGSPQTVRPAGRMRQTSTPASVRTTTPPADVLLRGPVTVLECLGGMKRRLLSISFCCLLYTSDAADDLLCVDLG